MSGSLYTCENVFCLLGSKVIGFSEPEYVYRQLDERQNPRGLRRPHLVIKIKFFIFLVRKNTDT
jgi:hypothetical protein